MKKTFHTKDGVKTKTLTQDEIVFLASEGDNDCKKELIKQTIKDKTDKEKIKLILEYLGL